MNRKISSEKKKQINDNMKFCRGQEKQKNTNLNVVKSLKELQQEEEDGRKKDKIDVTTRKKKWRIFQSLTKTSQHPLHHF